MNEINKRNLSEQTTFRLIEIIRIKDYFRQEINQRKSCIKNLGSCATAFDYIDEVLIVLSTTSSGVWSLYHFVCRCCLSTNWNSKCKFHPNFFSSNRNNQKITKHNKKQKEKT